MEVDTETGAGEDAQVRLRRRHRQHHQPADRRRARCTAAWCRASPRRCGRRRCTTTPGTLVSGSFVDYLLPTAADTISFDIDHTTQPVDDQHARHQGRRRGRHHRLDAGRGERGRRRGPAPRRQRHPDAVHARAGVEGDPRDAGGGGADRGRGDAALRRRPTPDRPARKERASDPRTVRLPGADHRSRRRSRALAEHGDDAKIMAGGQSLLPVLRMRLNAPEVVIDLGRIDVAARHPRRRRRDRHRRDDHALTTSLTTPWSREHALLITKAASELADAQIRHRGTFGGALAHADPAGDLGAPALALGRGVRDRRVRAAPARWRPTTSSSTSSRPRSARTRSSPRSGSPSTPAGAPTTRSSSGWPTSGRSWRSPRR